VLHTDLYDYILKPNKNFCRNRNNCARPIILKGLILLEFYNRTKNNVKGNEKEMKYAHKIYMLTASTPLFLSLARISH
jgi:hypothetical protein